MRFLKQLRTLGLLTLLALLAGCGGFTGGYSASPASFLIPGLNVRQSLPPAMAPLSAPAPPK